MHNAALESIFPASSREQTPVADSSKSAPIRRGWRNSTSLHDYIFLATAKQSLHDDAQDYNEFALQQQEGFRSFPPQSKYHEQEPGQQEGNEERTRQDPEGKKGSQENQEGSNEASVIRLAGSAPALPGKQRRRSLSPLISCASPSAWAAYGDATCFFARKWFLRPALHVPVSASPEDHRAA